MLRTFNLFIYHSIHVELFFYNSKFWRGRMSTYPVCVILLCIDGLRWDVVSKKSRGGVAVGCGQRGITNGPVFFCLDFAFVLYQHPLAFCKKKKRNQQRKIVLTAFICLPIQQCSTHQWNEGKPPSWKINHKLLGWMYN